MRPLSKTTYGQRVCGAFVLALLMVTGATSGALAHAVVVRSDPPDNANVTTAPSQIRLWFSERIDSDFCQAQVLDSQGQAVPATLVSFDQADQTLMIVTVPRLADGVYNVVYASMSAADGHPTQGHLVFRVGAAGAAQSGTPAREPPIALSEAVLHWLNFGALAALTGAIAVAVLFFGVHKAATAKAELILDVEGVSDEARRRVWGWAAWCALAALALGVLLIYRQASVLTLSSSSGGNTGQATLAAAFLLITRTPTGTLWIVRQVLLAWMVVFLFIQRRATAGSRSGHEGALVLSSLVVLATQALSGHAASLSPATALSVIVDTLHLVAAGLWVGGLSALVVGLLPLALARRGTPAFAALVRAGWGPFGGMASLSVGMIMATGLYNTGREVASLDALITTLYGRALIAKIALVLLAGAAGLLNSSMLHPRLVAPLAKVLRRPTGWTPLPLTRLPALVLVEVAAGLLILLATGVITSSLQPHGPAFAPAGSSAPAGEVSRQVDDLLVTFQAQPNRPGQNVILINVASSRRPAPAEILRVIVHFTFLGQKVGSFSADAGRLSPDVYQLAGNQLSLTGPWQVDVAVRRKGLEDSVATFNWTVASPSSARPTIVSDRPLEPVLTGAAALIMVVVLAIAALVRFRHGRPTGRTPELTAGSDLKTLDRA